MRGSYTDCGQPKVVDGIAGFARGRKKPPPKVYRVVNIVLIFARLVMLKNSAMSRRCTRSLSSGTSLLMRRTTDANSVPQIVFRTAPGVRSLAVLPSLTG